MLSTTKQTYLSRIRCRYLSFIVPLGSILVLLLLCISTVSPNTSISNSDNKAYALEDIPTASTTSLNGRSTTPTTSLTIGDGSSVYSNTGTSNNAIEISIDVKVEASMIDSYTLQIGSNNGSTMLEGPSTISPTSTTGVTVLADDTWGYKWGSTNNSNNKYKGITTTLTTIESANTATTNHSTSFTKPLTFAAKFSKDAVAGHYTTEVVLSLVATPRVLFNGITTMQQMTPEICSKAEVGDSTVLRDNRSYPKAKVTDKNGNLASTAQQISNEYIIAKYPDGRCWMAQNLRLTGSDSGVTNITSTNSNTSGNYNIPKNDKSAFPSSKNAAQASFLGTDNAGNVTGYYTWCTATAGTCSSATSDGSNAPSSVCPKGWKLPTGGTSSNTDFYSLFNRIGLLITLNTSGKTDWGPTQLNKVQNKPYNFTFTGSVYNGASSSPLSHQYGFWWSSTANGNYLNAYVLAVNSNSITPGTDTGSSGGYVGFAVRCIAEENAKWSNGADSGVQYMQDIKTGTNADSFCSSNLPNHASIKLKDKRDGNEYTVVKMADGKCWMTENLRIVNKTIDSTDSDMTSGSITIPTSSASGFNESNVSSRKVYITNNTGYYNWYTATAGTAPASGDALSSICPKSWKLPTGGSNMAVSDLGILLNAEGMGGYTKNDATSFRGMPYNFTYTGFVNDSGFSSDSYGFWWSSTAFSNIARAYALMIYTEGIGPNYDNLRRYGFAIRCLAR